MKALLAAPLSVVLLLATPGCSGSEKPAPDAGVDDSCGVDCDGQKDYGLIVGKCFEYSKAQTVANPPELGVLVGEVVTLEGGVKGIPVSYRSGGLTKMEDIFTIRDGDLYLLRRTWQSAQSVTYKDDAGNIVGVPWLRKNTVAGETVAGPVKADFINGAARTTDATNHSVAVTVATAADLKTPLEQYADGLRMLINETPLHGADTRRYFVRQTGFIKFATTLQITGGQSQEYLLQKIKDVAAGTFECG